MNATASLRPAGSGQTRVCAGPRAAQHGQAHATAGRCKPSHSADGRGQSLAAEVAAHEQQQQIVRPRTELLTDLRAVLFAVCRREALGIDAVVDQPDALRRHVVQPPVIVGAHLRQGHDDPLRVGVLPRHEFAEGAIPRQQGDHRPLHRPRPTRQQRNPLLPLRQTRAVVRLEHVAVPTASHVVDYVERDVAQHGFRGCGKSQTRVRSGQVMQDEGVPQQASPGR